MLGYEEYLSTLCPGGCGHPRDKAHHWDNDGWYEANETVCHACTARRVAEAEPNENNEARLLSIVDVRDYEKKPLPETPARKGGPRR